MRLIMPRGPDGRPKLQRAAENSILQRDGADYYAVTQRAAESSLRQDLVGAVPVACSSAEPVALVEGELLTVL